MEKFALFFLALVCTDALAYSGGRVQVFAWNQNQFYNVAHIYAMPIRYAVDPRLRHFSFEFGQHTYTFDVTHDIDIALQQWRDAGAGYAGPTFARVDNESDADLVFGISNQPPAHIPNATGYTSLARPGNSQASIMFVPSSFSMTLSTMVTQFPLYQPVALMQLMIRSTAIHEVGHGMGLAHSSYRDVENFSRMFRLDVSLAPGDDQFPHIMGSAFSEYLVERGLQLQRLVRPDDMVVSPVEIAAFRYVLTAGTQTCPPYSAYSRSEGPRLVSAADREPISCSREFPVNPASLLLLN
jgi:hypothetical protein